VAQEFTTVVHRVSLVLTAGTRTALTLAGVEVVPEVPVGDLDLEALQVRRTAAGRVCV
jgi:uncharacterized Rossmann fold enzyme